MKRGEIWWTNFDPSIGGEIQKIRPAIIISNNLSNEALNRVQVVPLTSNVGRLYPCETLLTVNHKKAKAMADQLTTVSKKRLSKKMGKASEVEIKELERAIQIQLDLI